MSGLCATLFNIGHIQFQNNEHDEAMHSWAETFKLAKSKGIAQALEALEGLSDQLQLPGGTKAWEAFLNEDSPRTLE